jgi:hypothetical protein
MVFSKALGGTIPRSSGARKRLASNGGIGQAIHREDSMANKTQPTQANVETYLATIDPARRPDSDRLVAMMAEVTGEPPVMWGSSIVGSGRYHYRYESGREGYSALVSFSARKDEFSIYLTGTYFAESGHRTAEILSRLGRHRAGKSCLYVRKLADIDEKVLRELMHFSVAELRKHYPS